MELHGIGFGDLLLPWAAASSFLGLPCPDSFPLALGPSGGPSSPAQNLVAHEDSVLLTQGHLCLQNQDGAIPSHAHTWGSEITGMRKQSLCTLLVTWGAGYLGSTWLNQAPFLPQAKQSSSVIFSLAQWSPVWGLPLPPSLPCSCVGLPCFGLCQCFLG